MRRSRRRPLALPSTALAVGLTVLGLSPFAPRATRAAQVASLAVETNARAMQPGEFVLFRITAPDDATTGVTVTAFDRVATALRIDDGTWRALVGVDLDTKPGVHVATITASRPTGPLSVNGTLLIEPKPFPTRRLTVNPALVDPPADALDRIKRETARTNDIYRSPLKLTLWHGAFLRPVADPANSRFGSRSIFNGTRSSPHTGADFLSGTGTPVKAPNRGRVRLAESLYFSGNTVILDHGLGLLSLFAHLSEFKVREGDTVDTGDVVGLVGATGRVTGPHLHWAMRLNGARIDPLSLLDTLGSEITAATRLAPLPVH